MALPDRTLEAEDAHVRLWSDSDDTDALVAEIEAAMEDRRPQLAARLVQLLDEHFEAEPGSALERAQRAANLILSRRNTPEENSWSELEDAWRDLRRSRMRRIRQRMRDRLSDRTTRIGRLDRRRR